LKNNELENSGNSKKENTILRFLRVSFANNYQSSTH